MCGSGRKEDVHPSREGSIASLQPSSNSSQTGTPRTTPPPSPQPGHERDPFYEYRDERAHLVVSTYFKEMRSTLLTVWHVGRRGFPS